MPHSLPLIEIKETWFCEGAQVSPTPSWQKLSSRGAFQNHLESFNREKANCNEPKLGAVQPYANNIYRTTIVNVDIN